MYFFKKPFKQQIREFIEAQSKLEFTYSMVGATGKGEHPAGYVVDHNRIQLGQGKEMFQLARQALCEWRHFQFDWIELHHKNQIPEPDQTVGVLAHALGLWVLNACRIVYVMEETEPVQRFTFAYGTLPEHAESGEERFQVEWHAKDNSVWYDILAYSRPNQRLSKLAYPYVRRKQKQFALDSMQAMKNSVTDRESKELPEKSKDCGNK
ncbi:MAG: DUF1990 domain-containing protein [Gimesia sp.]|nr:DUF1990 domain-containing protein [Gimesia sp.]